MSVVPREIGAAARSAMSPPNSPQFIFEQGQVADEKLSANTPHGRTEPHSDRFLSMDNPRS
jgi:hypothetical protein